MQILVGLVQEETASAQMVGGVLGLVITLTSVVFVMMHRVGRPR